MKVSPEGQGNESLFEQRAESGGKGGAAQTPPPLPRPVLPMASLQSLKEKKTQPGGSRPILLSQNTKLLSSYGHLIEHV